MAYCQTDSSSTSTHQFHAYLGLQVPDLNKLNSELGTNNYPQFKQNCFTVGLGMVKFHKKVIVQEDLSFYSQTQKNDSISTLIRSISFGQSIFGYSYIKNKNFQMYSLFGLTYYNTTVKIIRDIPSSVSFNSYSSALGNQVEMTTNNFTANITTHINYLIKIGNNENILIIGLRGDYYLPLENSKWTTNKKKLDNAPIINPGGAAVRFVIGFTY